MYMYGFYNIRMISIARYGYTYLPCYIKAIAVELQALIRKQNFAAQANFLVL